MRQRRLERLEREARENQDISRWLAEKAPTEGEQMAQELVDFVVHGNVGTGRFFVVPPEEFPSAWEIAAEGELDVMRIVEAGRTAWSTAHPISSARSPLTRDMVEAKIINNTVDVDEVFWDLVSAIDAHRNGATALDRPWRPVDESTPVWDELTTLKWDPTKERGPREVDYVRKLAKQS